MFHQCFESPLAKLCFIDVLRIVTTDDGKTYLLARVGLKNLRKTQRRN